MAYTDYAKNRVLADCLYVGLFSAAPSDAGGGTELAGSGYARQAIAWTLTGDRAVNSADINFANSGADWLPAGWIGIFDAANGGHLMDWMPMTPVQLLADGTLTILAGDLKMDF
jgi:hypothetical protein